MDRATYKRTMSSIRRAKREVPQFWRSVSYCSDKPLKLAVAIRAIKAIATAALDTPPLCITVAQSPLDALRILNVWMTEGNWLQQLPAELWDAKLWLSDGYTQLMKDVQQAERDGYLSPIADDVINDGSSDVFYGGGVMDHPIQLTNDLECDLRQQCQVNGWRYVPHVFMPQALWYRELAHIDYLQHAMGYRNRWFNEVKNLIGAGVYGLLYHAGCLILSPPPSTYGSPDAINHPELHNAHGKAVAFPDGYGLCYFREVLVPERWILQPESITKAEIVTEKNIERRRVLMEILGETRFAQLLDLQLMTEETYNGQQFSLWSAMDNMALDDYLYFLKVTCPSTAREYYLCIPEEGCQEGPVGAAAWTFGLTRQAYQCTIET